MGCSHRKQLANVVCIFWPCKPPTLRIPTQAANLINDRLLRKDWRGAQELYSNALFLLILICGFLIAFFIFTQNLINWNKLIGLDTISLAEAKWLNLIFVLFYSFTAILSLPSQAYRAYGLFSRGQMIGNVRILILFFFITVAVLSGFGPVTVGILYLTTLLTDIFWIARDFPRRCPELKFKIELINGNSIKATGRNGLFFTLLMLGETLSLQTNLMITSHILGATAILGFILMRTLINLLSTVSYEVGRVLWPEIALLKFERDTKAIQFINIMLIKITTFSGIILGAFFFFSAGDLISCWAGVDDILPSNVVMILGLSVISKALYGGSRIYWLALNRLGVLVWAQLIGGIIGTILTALLTPVLGLFGSALAFVLSDILFFTLPSLVCSTQISGLSLKRVVREIFLSNLAIFMLLFLFAWLTYMPSVSGKWSRAAIAAALYFPFATSVLYWILLSKHERLLVSRGIKTFQLAIGTRSV